MKIAIHEAKAKLSALINAALSGEQAVLTEHGRPVAEIRPFAAQRIPLKNCLQSKGQQQEPELNV